MASITTPRPKIPDSLKKQILAEQLYRCHDCKNPLEHKLYDVDHIIPRCISEDDTRSNLCILCLPCHGRKTRLSSERRDIALFKKFAGTRTPICWTCKKHVSPYWYTYAKFTCNQCWLKSFNAVQQQVITDLDTLTSMMTMLSAK
jgi:hypothetical protein